MRLRRSDNPKTIEARRRTRMLKFKALRPLAHLVAEANLGRALIKGVDVVHHINLDRSDNNPGNIYVCSSKSEHQGQLHGTLDDVTSMLIKVGVIKFSDGRYRVEEKAVNTCNKSFFRDGIYIGKRRRWKAAIIEDSPHPRDRFSVWKLDE